MWENVLEAWLDVRWPTVQAATSLGTRRYCYRGRGLQGGERAQLGKASREGPGAARETSLLSFLRLSACPLTLQLTVCSQPWVQSRCRTHWVLKKPILRQTGGLRGQLETKGESPQCHLPWPQSAEGLSRQRCLPRAGFGTDVTAPHPAPGEDAVSPAAARAHRSPCVPPSCYSGRSPALIFAERNTLSI